MHGPDGVVKTNKGTQYVSEGKSLWEFGTDNTPIKKANDDINKRTNNPPYDINPSEQLMSKLLQERAHMNN